MRASLNPCKKLQHLKSRKLSKNRRPKVMEERGVIHFCKRTHDAASTWTKPERDMRKKTQKMKKLKIRTPKINKGLEVKMKRRTTMKLSRNGHIKLSTFSIEIEREEAKKSKYLFNS